MSGHSIIVKAGLSGDEFIALSKLAEARGLAHSALIRMLIRQAIAADSARTPDPAQGPKWDDNVVPVGRPFVRFSH